LTPPAYRERLSTGIVHFGPGAFHRAHQADYIDRLLHEDPRWGIAAVSLRSPGTIEALRDQRGLYTLAVLDAEMSYRTIGAHGGFYGPGEAAGVRDLLRNPSIGIVSMTVTEKGYCLAADGTLDLRHADIVHDLANPHQPRSIVGWLALALQDRRAAKRSAFTPVCCDNMVSNGKKLGAAVLEFARQFDPELATWIEGEVRFPDTMVDSITPATDERLRNLVREKTGADDLIPVSREAFTQWVIEDSLPSDGPDLASVGVVLAADVSAWEKAKLRILNGSHSTLAYLGLLLGHETVADAMGDRQLAGFVGQLIEQDVIPGLQPSPIDLSGYSRQILDRFRNPAIHHKLSQIAWDGSQKLPYRLLDSVAEAIAAGRPLERLALPVAAWMRFIESRAAEKAGIVDPLAETLLACAADPDPVSAFLSLRQVFPEPIAANPGFAGAVRSHWQRIGETGARACI
jgi:fructuronate reductase